MATLHYVALLLPFVLGHLPGYLHKGYFLTSQRMAESSVALTVL